MNASILSDPSAFLDSATKRSCSFPGVTATVRLAVSYPVFERETAYVPGSRSLATRGVDPMAVPLKRTAAPDGEDWIRRLP
ncbi:MAG: hypothetical protein A4E36_00775 [Methanoregulaceae archaeon PtaB.Bin009]|nr:MAG: hypothetical protein A4E36_00775 [Methanoregulaceae archaeon PtaB.Bin009]OPY39468.1 MAG: hypothetical protein A4E41_01702 [Methanoregulaceae archaeon PtaU1.Bin066]